MFKGEFEMSLGPAELLIILAIVLLIFGVGRISKIGGELGKGIQAFREGVKEGTDPDDTVSDNAEVSAKSDAVE